MKDHHWLQSRRFVTRCWRREHQRARIKHVRQRAGIILRIGRDLREGDVTGRLDEFLELRGSSPACGRSRRRRPSHDGPALPRDNDRRSPCGRCRRESATMSPVPRSCDGSASLCPVSARSNVMASTPDVRLRTDVPEALRLARVRVVPAITGRGRRAGPCRCASRGDKADRSTGCDRTARAPVIIGRAYPAGVPRDARTHHGAPVHHGASSLRCRADRRRSFAARCLRVGPRLRLPDCAG